MAVTDSAPAAELSPASRPADQPTAAQLAEAFGDRASNALRYAELLSTSGVERGLLGPREAPRLWSRHLLNCVVVAPVLHSGAVADLGSGAGLPGIVVALARPELQITLIEPLSRRVAFLSEALQELGLDNVEVLRARGEELAGRRAFATVMCRAVASLDRLAALALPLVNPGGELLALKGQNADAELVAAVPRLRRFGAHSWRVERLGAGLVNPPTTVVRVNRGADEQ